jgi:hypothetical protein
MSSIGWGGAKLIDGKLVFESDDNDQLAKADQNLKNLLSTPAPWDAELTEPQPASWEKEPRIDIEMPAIGCKWFIQLSWMMEGCIEDIDQEVHDWSAQPDLTRKCWVRTKVDTRTTMHWMLWSEARPMIIKLVKDGFFA